ncbi:transcriptional regulator, tetR family [Sanguibacter keddieii DSM 10542]|uniref:Transcriptional regulator, tetR family n=1 Tax=Sanguibacter keddieii (strain ATCC 51767 / DSM 10542 / NCFB 3025 / ST-74) TaxID=446469 RepID=D1BHG1_SANKS|nr:TetR/AcrR family transcriptional regulator [Sanguibacter keddieii]ACZ21881.1 transcriptional regulator, tetR family [Sanguibacter keddieii DSM 10542]
MTADSLPPPRTRLSRDARHAQLLDVARDLIRDDGTDELTLARLADRAGVTKPLVYDHFGDRSGVLAELYRAFEARQRNTLAAALDGAGPALPDVAAIVASAYVDCCIAEGRELADVVSALAGSPTLDALRQEAQDEYLAMCRDALTPHSSALDAAGLVGIVGAGDALGRAAITGRIGADRARAALTKVVTALASGEMPTPSDATA